jgi:hypothetical protein
VAVEDVEPAGGTVRAGEAVVVSTAAANRDPEVFDDAEELVLDRAENRHVAFGHGLHHCLGAQPARMELQEAVGSPHAEFPDLSPTCAWPSTPPTCRGGPAHSSAVRRSCCSAGGQHVVQDSRADVGHQIGELAEAHLDALPEVVGDHDSLLRRRGVVDEQLRAAAVALAAEGGDVAHGVLRVDRW